MAHLTQMAGPRRPELRVRGRRHRGRHRARARARPPDRADHRQLLGRPGPGHPVRPAADRVRRGPGARLAGRPADVRRPGARSPARGRPQTISLGPIASQEAIKELGTNGGGIVNANSAHPFENPTALTNLARAAAHPGHPVRADRDVRRAGGRPAPGLGPVRRDGRRSSSVAATVAIVRRGARQPAVPGGPRPGARQHGGQGDPLRGVRRRPVRRDHHRHEHGRRQRDARQPHAARRPRAPVPACCSARSRRAASAPACTGCSCSRCSPCSSPA